MSYEASTSQSHEEEYIPDAKTATDLVNQFAEVTGTDTACAQFYLQDRNWDLQRSIDAYFQVKQTGGLHILTDGDEPQIILNINKDVQKFLENATIKPPKEFRIISWNIDGLDEHNLKIRTKAVVKVIELEKPDIVFLQEVVPKTFDYLQENLPQYKFIPGCSVGYFAVTMLNVFTVYYDSHDIIEYPNSTMGRNLIKANAHMGDLKLCLLNTHLESTAEHASERVNQLHTCFKEIAGTDTAVNVIFGGDLNMRDKEISEAGGLPDRTRDAWESCGARKEAQYTWDTMRNTNKQFPGKFKPRMRFDRVYLRPSSKQTVQAETRFFGLIGLQKISGYQCFPSDHWGLLVDFDANSP